MNHFPGTPGTLSGLVLRISQSFFAIGSTASMATASGFFNITAFCYLVASMGLQIIWSSGLAFLDAYALMKKKAVNSPVLVSLVAVGDWVIATLSLAAASASAGITVLYFSDIGGCNYGGDCPKYQMSVALAFLSWIMIALSALLLFWILASD
ncbi:CASP-like protein 5B3 isoform X1 [Malania oleifera]|uniref:CASP-like protein 5B3 isoform X1 n=1 Tax=Malania oleifera TaxID=397392 RepID=UPI0025AE1BFB|nr:CASP-like protein 5B3 isoform X1 [Malania oleifera]XP_057959510.1 CASP-like protein 5B3 isoform X1 [Malania oleifera]